MIQGECKLLPPCSLHYSHLPKYNIYYNGCLIQGHFAQDINKPDKEYCNQWKSLPSFKPQGVEYTEVIIKLILQAYKYF